MKFELATPKAWSRRSRQFLSLIMKYYVYILHSKSLGKFYTGMSQFSAKRKRQHCNGETYWTSRTDDWIEIWKTEISTSQEARALERKIKKRGARRFLIDNGIAAVPPPAG